MQLDLNSRFALLSLRLNDGDPLPPLFNTVLVAMILVEVIILGNQVPMVISVFVLEVNLVDAAPIYNLMVEIMTQMFIALAIWGPFKVLGHHGEPLISSLENDRHRDFYLVHPD
jgi:hypothetical protein